MHNYYKHFGKKVVKKNMRFSHNPLVAGILNNERNSLSGFIKEETNHACDNATARQEVIDNFWTCKNCNNKKSISLNEYAATKPLDSHSDRHLCIIMTWAKGIDDNFGLFLNDDIRKEMIQELVLDYIFVASIENSVYPTFEPQGELKSWLNTVNASNVFETYRNYSLDLMEFFQTDASTTEPFESLLELQTTMNKVMVEIRTKLVYGNNVALRGHNSVENVTDHFENGHKLARYLLIRGDPFEPLWNFTNGQSSISMLLSFGFLIKPSNVIHQVYFNEERLDPDEVFQPIASSIGVSCISTKNKVKLIQKKPCPLGGLRLSLFTGIPGLNQYTMNYGLLKNPAWSVVFDTSETEILGSTMPPVYFKSGQRTSITLIKEKIDRLPGKTGSCSQHRNETSHHCLRIHQISPYYLLFHF